MSLQILILGGGTGGVAAANILGKTLGKEHEIILVDKNEKHLFLAGLPLLIVGARQPSQITRSLTGLKKKNVRFLQAAVTAFVPEKKTVETERGPLRYDYAIIALGAERRPETIPGQAERAFNPYNLTEALLLQKKLADFSRGQITLFITNLPFTGTIAPYEIIFLLDAFFRRKKKRNEVQLNFVTPEPLPLGTINPLVGKKVQKMMTERGINLYTQANVLSLDRKENSLILDGDVQIAGGLFIGIPSHWGPAPFRKSLLAGKNGWLQAHPLTLATELEHVYAVGDAVGITSPLEGAWLPKTGFFAHYQAEVAARNIALLISGKKPAFRFQGGAKGAAMLTGLNKGQFVSLNAYAAPARLKLSGETRFAYLAKALFEKYWLTSWF
ncbi:MAG TPA: FAD-dependent oxidoreductase [Firmicutes bacterium]|nr:FAD-dependent oxidoreductase [Bacillota bacterium]